MTGELTFVELVAREGLSWPPDGPDCPRHELYGEVEPPALARAYVPSVETAESEPDDEWQPGDLTDLWRRTGC